ncbi:MAG: acylphosphatase [Bacteroidales bacterium]|nr:acylphosphatase [Bacteroidales bacterium]
MPDIKKKHKNIIVKGRVQGVGFRFSARNMAISLGIKGYVRNLYDGNVLIEAEGSEIQLKHFLEWCYKGPGYASVEDIEISDGEFKDYLYFDIKH